MIKTLLTRQLLEDYKTLLDRTESDLTNLKSELLIENYSDVLMQPPNSKEYIIPFDRFMNNLTENIKILKGIISPPIQIEDIQVGDTLLLKNIFDYDTGLIPTKVYVSGFEGKMILSPDGSSVHIGLVKQIIRQ